MSKVDVLAVLDSVLEGRQTHSEIIEARAAVAELVRRGEYLSRTGEGMILFRAALANIGSTK